jgi:hypothetical protein
MKEKKMNEEEYNNKYANLKILKSIQEYLKAEERTSTAVYPVKIPNKFIYEVLQQRGAEGTDELIHEIFRLGFSIWSDRVYNDVFGSQESLEEFIEIVKNRNKE